MSLPKILLVDDEPFNIDYLEQELEESKYITIAATNGKEALEQVQAESPDLVLLDIMMPIMDGFEVLARLKDDPATRDIPVIIISADSHMHSVVKGIQLGAEDYLPKPFEPILLRARISSSLEKKRLRDLQQLYLKGLERELDIGREIQLGFLPAELPKVEGWEIAAFFKAAREVTGDFYDSFVLPNGHFVCVLGDVCDKGVGAALYMTLFRSLMRAALTTDFFFSKDLSPLTAAERLLQAVAFTNHYIAETHADANMFATLFVGMIDQASGLLSYINCGNESPFLVRKDRALETLPPTGPAVGIITEAKFSVKEVVLEKHDLFLVFTDGVPDSKNAQDEFFGHERVRSILEDCDQISPTILLQQVQDRTLQFIGAAPQFDDITLLALKKV